MYGDSYHEIHRLLETLDADLVLSGLADFAAGNHAIVQGEPIAALQGLGENPEPLDQSYENAMIELLLLGVRN